MKEKIKEEIEKLFDSEGIEYFSSIPIKNTEIIKPYLIDRLDFVPQSVIIFLIPYYTGEGENLSAYAVSRDYHIFLKEIGKRICTLLKGFGFSCVAFGDHSPLDERDAAAKCALGIIGDNGLLINEKYGTYVFIGEIVTDLPTEELSAPNFVTPEGCEHCGRCLCECPMNEIGECLSALTQKKGVLTEEEREHIKQYGSVWGCDLCQVSCPHNKNPQKTPVKFFYDHRLSHITKAVIDEMSDEEFSRRAYSWRGKETLLRNIEIFESQKC